MPGPPRKPGGPSKKGAKAATTMLSQRPREELLATLPELPPASEVVGFPADLIGADETKWSPVVLRWWEEIWTSPMVSEWTAADYHTLVILAGDLQESLNPMYKAADRARFQKLWMDGIKQFGLTPEARVKLRWTIAQGNTAVQRSEQLRAAATNDRTFAKEWEKQQQDLYNQYS